MKIILSRKGFDSAAGGYANPILLDGTLLSLPIPDKSSDIKYTEFRDVSISYHKDESSKDECFQSAVRGQEFVMGSNKISNLWAKMILKN